MKSSYGSAISQSEEYKSFRGSIPLKNITVAPNETWTVYDTGSRSSGTSPLLCLPPISGTADIFFKQCLGKLIKEWLHQINPNPNNFQHCLLEDTGWSLSVGLFTGLMRPGVKDSQDYWIILVWREFTSLVQLWAGFLVRSMRRWREIVPEWRVSFCATHSQVIRNSFDIVCHCFL